MINCFFVSDLHGHIDRFEKLFRQIKSEKPDVLFIGGDVLPGGHYYRNRAGIEYDDFLNYYIFPHLRNLQKDMPYKSAHDRAALDGKMVAHAPLDVHVGSIAIKEFIEKKQPFITLHGHIHESSRITGLWHEMIGRTYTFSAAYDEKDLALVIFDLEEPSRAKRLIL
ncbi:MAG: hypothetical protein B1H05_03040 [Candidatus Cloacimonas sp. 4484_140]|nr:MAG: hypothetical protein B1H05_03040 [Candidatus Cloacimonas sp. 4484_140]